MVLPNCWICRKNMLNTEVSDLLFKTCHKCLNYTIIVINQTQYQKQICERKYPVKCNILILNVFNQSSLVSEDMNPLSFSSYKKCQREDENLFQNNCNQLRKWLVKHRHNFCEQEISDLNCELLRLNQVCLFLMIKRTIEENGVHDRLKREKYVRKSTCS